MAVEIAAGEFFPVPRILLDEKDPEKAAAKHRELLAQALNEVASAAFSPEVLYDTATTVQDSTGSAVAYSGLTLSVYTPVPAFIVVAAQILWEVKTPGTGRLLATLEENSSTVAQAVGGADGATEADAGTLTLIAANVVVEPRTAYVYTVEIQHTGSQVFTANPSGVATAARMASLSLPRSIV